MPSPFFILCYQYTDFAASSEFFVEYLVAPATRQQSQERRKSMKGYNLVSVCALQLSVIDMELNSE